MGLYGDEDMSGILQATISINNDHRILQFPLPNVPPPEYILGFKSIGINYLDSRVLNFFKCIASKLNDVQFDMNTRGMEEWGVKEEDKRTAMHDCMLNTMASKIRQFKIYENINFDKFNQLFPGFIDQLDSIFIYFNKGIDVGVLYKWLTDREENGGSKQKMLELKHNNEFLRDFFVRIRQEFTNATGPVNFIVNFRPRYLSFLEFVEFTLENAKTGEILVSYQKKIGGRHVRLLLRCPKGEEERWKEEGEKKLMRNRHEATKIPVNISKFGDFNNMA